MTAQVSKLVVVVEEGKVVFVALLSVQELVQLITGSWAAVEVDVVAVASRRRIVSVGPSGRRRHLLVFVSSVLQSERDVRQEIRQPLDPLCLVVSTKIALHTLACSLWYCHRLIVDRCTGF